MRVLYIDIDSQRPDHFGCYGYHRKTSPNIDRIAANGVRFDKCYVSDSPCLPSRTALFSGRFGIHTGVVSHGGVASIPFNEGSRRAVRSKLGLTNWMTCLEPLKMKRVTISPFGDRHSAFHWYAGFTEIYNTGGRGIERADEIAPVALDWIKQNGRDDNWFLHVNMWDPHSGFRTPMSFGEPFANDPLPAWLTDEVRQEHWQGIGAHSAQEIGGWTEKPYTDPAWGYDSYPRQPWQAKTMKEVRMMFDGYDTGVLFADLHLGYIFNALADQNVLEETAIIISADHGEALGELNVYGDHMFADEYTCHVPLIIKWPGVTQAARVDDALHYSVDMSATVIELLGGKVPANWDGQSFAGAMRAQQTKGREQLILSHGAWSCQRAARFDDFLVIKNYHDGYHCLPEFLVFDLKNDPHEQFNLAGKRPDLVARAKQMLGDWHDAMMRTSTTNVDPMWTVLQEGGPNQTRGCLKEYCERLRQTGRGHWADKLLARHPNE